MFFMNLDLMHVQLYIVHIEEDSTVCFKKTEAKQLARQEGQLNSTVCIKKTEAKQLVWQEGRLNSTVCFKKTEAKQLAGKRDG